jgi:PfaD family protein
MEERTVDLFLKYGVRSVSASAFLRLTPALIRYRLQGLQELPGGRVRTPNKVFAKISNPVVALQFMSPAPQAIIDQLLAAGKITAEEARLAAFIPVAEDITSEADSGGHTDGRPLSVLLPEILRQRDEMMGRFGYKERGITLRVGAAGGLGDPLSIRAAFAAGADYVLTGSINQATIQAGTSPEVKEMLTKATMTDMAMAPAGDMFEMGAQVQVLKRGNFYSQRGKYLFEVYKENPSLEAIPAKDRAKIETDIFRRPIDDVWQGTADYWEKRDPNQLAKANRDPKFKMALTFRWYLGMTSRWPLVGDKERRNDYQIWCGPSMGSFNSWVKGTWLEDLAQRDVAQIGMALLASTAVLTRAAQLQQAGIAVPPTSILAQPWPQAQILALLNSGGMA